MKKEDYDVEEIDDIPDLSEASTETRIKFYVHYFEENYTDCGDLIFHYFIIFLPVSAFLGFIAFMFGNRVDFGCLIALNAVYLLQMTVVPFIKKGYRFRFLSEGIHTTLLSLLLVLAPIILLSADKQINPKLIRCLLLFYLASVAVILTCVIRSLKSETHWKALIEGPSSTAVVWVSSILILFLISLPVAGGILSHFGMNSLAAVYFVGGSCMFISVALACGYINYVKYYYCIKYEIQCSESGRTTSFHLDYGYMRWKKAKKKALKWKKREKKYAKISASFRKKTLWGKIIIIFALILALTLLLSALIYFNIILIAALSIA